jgi:hypothetical protein
LSTDVSLSPPADASRTSFAMAESYPHLFRDRRMADHKFSLHRTEVALARQL